MKSLLFLLSALVVSITVVGQNKNDKDAVDARFKEFIATENRGDSLAIRKMVWQSSVSPDWDKERISFLGKNVARIFVPVAISLPVRPVPTPFFLVAELIKQGNEWKLASNVAFPVPH